VRRLAALVPLTLLVLSLPTPARAAGPEMVGLQVQGALWRPDNLFALVWQGNPTDVVGYRFRNVPWASQEVVAGSRAEARILLEIPVPPSGEPLERGEYQIEMWLWRQGEVGGERGPPAYETLRYDPVTPAPPAAVTVPSGWVDGRGPISAVVARPPAAPVSGISGYAVSLTPRPGESPCVSPSRCFPSELDLPGGAADPQIVFGQVPEGVDYLNVVSVSGSGLASAPRSVPIRVDATAPSVRFAGVPSGWVDHPVAVTATAEDPFSGIAPAGPNGPFTALAVDGGVPTQALGGAVGTIVSGQGTHLVAGWARDALGNAGAAAGAPSATVRIDETAPRVGFATAQRPDDPELIVVQVADSLAGPSAERGAIEVRPAGTRRRFQPLPTDATATGLLARWSSDDFPPGSYEFRASGYDAAGNSTETTRRLDGKPMVLSNPIKVPTAVESGFGGARLVWQHCHRVDGGRRCQRESVTDFDSRPAVWTVPYGRSLRFGGVLRASGGAPLAGQAVEVVETFAPGSRLPQRRTTVTTRPDGRFDARLAPGPSRRVEAFFPGTRTLTRGSGRQVTMAVRAGVRLRASTTAARIGGRPVLFSGRLLAEEARIPRTGRPIELQFRLPGGEWTEFRSVQTDRRGRFRYPYAFTDDDSRGIRFQFRAVSPEQSDWPYRPAASASVAVTGY
jgi:hypothetical protein